MTIIEETIAIPSPAGYVRTLVSRRSILGTAAGLLVLLAGATAAQTPKGTESISAPMLEAHNTVRAKVGVAPLKWSDKLAAVARQWADHLAMNGLFAHSRNPDYGENLYQIQGAPATPSSVVNTWVSEARDYDYTSNSCAAVCGHYTQIVWSDTKEVGCAVERNPGREVWVCEYSPPGNFVGKKPY